MKTLRLSVYVIVGFLVAFTLSPAKPVRKPHPHTSTPTGIVLHLPSDGAFQFYAMKQCGGTVDTPDAYVEWDYEGWPAGCYPSLWARASYGWIQMQPTYVPNWVEWIPANDVLALDFEFIAPAGFWGTMTQNYASEFDLCGNYLGEFLIQMTSAGYPANGEYWIDYDATGTIQVRTGTEPLDFDTFNQDGTPRSQRSVGPTLIGDASGLPNLCP